MEDEKSSRTKRPSLEITAERTKEKNLKNSAMSAVMTVNGQATDKALSNEVTPQPDSPSFQPKPAETVMLLGDQSETSVVNHKTKSQTISALNAVSPV